ncbi:hypothetical protein JXB41_02735 [Candidatus Woesearchaeota archaeon]|nr:hypothetical protein [Candidatus Woesearchaeota archaeon]
MKKIILILGFLILIPVISAKELVYNDWVFNNQTIYLDSKEYAFLVSNAGNNLIVKFDGYFEVIDKRECILVSPREFCFNGSSYSNEINDFKAYIEISYLKPELEIRRTIDNNILKVGEDANFEIEITNTGDITSKDADFIEEFPAQVVIKSVSGACDKIGNKISWHGDIKTNEIISCEYEIYTTEKIDSVLKAAVFYNDGFSDQVTYSGPIHLYSSSILGMDFSATKDQIQINENTELFINLTNTEGEAIEITKLEIKIPDELIVDKTSLEKENNVYKWEGKIKSNDAKSLSFLLSGKLTGVSVINGNMEYEYNNIEFKNLNFKTNVKVKEQGLEIDSSLADNTRYDSNQNIAFRVKVNNKNEYSDIKNIEFNIDTELFYVDNKSLDSIEKNRTALVLNMNSPVANVYTTENFPVLINISYESVYGEKFFQSLTRNIIVEPIKKIIIKKTISPVSVEEKKQAVVKVDITNERNIDLENIYVSEFLPSGLSIEGPVSAIVELKKGETKTAYSYKIIVQEVQNTSNFILNTTAKYSKDEKSYLFTGSGTLEVIPKKLKISVQKSVTEKEVYMGEIIPVKYVIENQEQEPAFNLILYASENNYIDTLNNFNFSIPKLNPGEKIIIEKEQIRPKKTGEIIIDSSVIYYEDIKGRISSTESSSFALNVKESHSKGPVIIIEKSSDIYVTDVNDNVEITLKIKNTGDEDADIALSDNDKTWGMKISANKEEIINYNLSFPDPGEITLGRAYAYYTYLNNEYRTCSNQIKVKVMEEEKNSEEENQLTESEENNEPLTNTGKEPESNLKKNIFRRFFDWIFSVFKK